MDVAIVGAGVGGLALAILLSRAGHNVTVLERFDEARPLGSGLMLQPAGLVAMHRLGLRDAIEALGHRITRLHGRTIAGRTIFDLSYSNLGADHYALAVHRAALHGTLWAAFKQCGATLLTGREIGAPNDPLLAAADIVVDASGARSVLRAAVSTRQARVFAYGAVWATVGDNGGYPNTLAQRYHHASMMLGLLPLGRREADGPCVAALFWSLRPDQYDAWRRDFATWRRDLPSLWPELAPVATTLTDPDEFQHASYFHFNAAQPWRGKLVLIGDSAHATSPQLGQGANQALIDAVVLTDALAATRDAEAAFALYAASRRDHVRFYQYASWLMTPFFQSDSRALAAMRDWFFHPMRRLPWLHREMLRTLAGLKIGLFASSNAEQIVNRVARS